MVCDKCGKQVPDNAKFCDGCGAPVQVAATPKMPGRDNKKAVFEKFKKYIIGGGVAAVALIALLVIFGIKKPVFDLNKLSEVEFSGYNGYGHVSVVQVPRQEFLQKYGKKIMYNSKLSNAEKMKLGRSAANAFYDMVIDGADYNFTPGYELKNSDKVTMHWNVNEQIVEHYFKCDLKAEDKDFEVTGLEEVGSFDVFADITPKFSGYDGYGTLEINYSGDSYGLSFRADKSYGLSNGETVTVAIDGDAAGIGEYCARNYGAVPETMEKTYEISGLMEVKSFDPFEYVDVKWTGVSGRDGDVTITKKGDLPAMAEISFEAYHEGSEEYIYEDLSNGDRVIVKAELYADPEYFVEEYGCLPLTTEKAYTVEGLPYYARTAVEVSEEAMQELVAQGESVVKAYVSENWDLATLNSVTNVGYYFLPEKVEGGTSIPNYIYQIYKVNATIDQTKETVDFYYPVWFGNAKVSGGDTEIDITDYGKPSADGFWEEEDGFFKKDEDGRDRVFFSGKLTLEEIETRFINDKGAEYNIEKNITE